MKNSFLTIFAFVFLLPTTILAQQRYRTKIDQSNMDLPPGAILHPKRYLKNQKDYSYKLSSTAKNANTTYSLNQFLAGFGKDIKAVDTKNTYYANATTYFNALSNNAKKRFTAKELSHIYMYDKNLRNKLLAIQ